MSPNFSMNCLMFSKVPVVWFDHEISFPKARVFMSLSLSVRGFGTGALGIGSNRALPPSPH